MRHLIPRSCTIAVSWLVLLIVLAGLLLATCSAAVTTSRRPVRAPVYTVGELRAYLAQDAGAWVGRTILVRGMVAGEPAYHPSPSLVDANAAAAVDPLPLTWTGPDPLRANLRRLPILGGIVPRAQILHWGEVAVYRVELRATPAGSCPSAPCYQAVLLDAAS